jgi:histidyl-tRNA synthetase
MNELNLFPSEASGTTKLLFANFGKNEEPEVMKTLHTVRKAGINAEIYPEAVKMGKQFKYADDKEIPYVAIIGENEITNHTVALKDMKSGTQETLTLNEVIAKLTR